MISEDFVDSVLTKPMDRESYTKTVGKGHGGCSQFGFRLTGPLPEPSPRYLAKAQFIRWHKDLPEKIWPGETVDTLFDDTRDFSGLIAGDLEDLRRFFARSRSAGYRMLQFGIPEEAWSGLEVLLKSYPQHTITQYVGIPKDGFELALKARKELRFSGAGRPWIEIAAPKAKTLQEIGDFFYRLRLLGGSRYCDYSRVPDYIWARLEAMLKHHTYADLRASLIIGHSRLTAEFTRIRKERSEKENGHAPLLYQY